MSKKKEEIAVVEDNSAALAAIENEKGWDFEGDPNDILVPRILIAQATSEAVGAGKVTPGSLFRSTNFETLAKNGEPVKIIPLYMHKTWIVSHKIGERFEFLRIEPCTAQNANLDWTWEEGGSQFKREQSLNFFCLLPADVAAEQEMLRAAREDGEIPDLDKALLPVVVSFKSTSYKSGKTLATHFGKASNYKLPAFINTFEISTEYHNNDKGRYYTLNVQSAGKTDKSYMELCRRWYDIVSSTNVKVDEEATPAAPAYDDTETQMQF